MDDEELLNDVMFHVERFSAVLNVPNISEGNASTLNTLIARQLAKITPAAVCENE